MPESEARRAWLAENTERVVLKLNVRTDEDIIAAIEGKTKQTEIKRLIRVGLEAEHGSVKRTEEAL